MDGGVTWTEHRVAFPRYVKSCGWPDPQPVRLTTPLDFTDHDMIVHFQRDDAFGWDTGYAIATVRADGKIVVCYWMKTVNQDERNYIAATIWNAAGARTKSGGL